MSAVRLVPVAPFTVVNVAAGAFNVRFFDFALGTLIGMAPGIFAIAVFGERLDPAGIGGAAVILAAGAWTAMEVREAE